MKAATKTEPKERPILFSSPMVKAILDGTKLQTRRVMKVQPKTSDSRLAFSMSSTERDQIGKFRWIQIQNDIPVESTSTDYFACPYGRKGERLWVRETFAEFAGILDKNPYVYRADGTFDTPAKEHLEGNKWRPSIFMPREASRITLEITNVRVERLQDISEEDAEAEGLLDEDHSLCEKYGLASSWTSCRDLFQRLWEEINGKKHPWSSNPWVWVVEFRKIDA